MKKYLIKIICIAVKSTQLSKVKILIVKKGRTFGCQVKGLISYGHFADTRFNLFNSFKKLTFLSHLLLQLSDICNGVKKYNISL